MSRVGSSAAPFYRTDIDGLRALSILPVVAFHAHLPGFQAGFVGVDVFFVISGYLITSLLFRESDQTELAVIRRLSEQDMDVFYIDVQSVFCDPLEGCDLFQGQSLPISFDGKHLTLEGAELLGAKLSPTILPILQAVIAPE